MSYPHYFVKLTRVEERILWDEILLCQSRGEIRKTKRLKAIWFSSKRLTFAQIAETLGVTYRTVQRWVTKYRKDDK